MIKILVNYNGVKQVASCHAFKNIKIGDMVECMITDENGYKDVFAECVRIL